jgi:hypothetical protein
LSAEDRRPRHTVKRILVLAGIVLCGLNVWTGGPLLAVWVGSHLANSSGQATIGVVAAIVLTLGAVDLALVRIMASLNAVYDRLTGRRPQVRRMAWLRSMGDTPSSGKDPERRISAAEVIIVATVVVAVIAFEIWFFFFSSGGGIGSGST